MPWKNRGGETTEIMVSPQAGDFDWRVSIAKVDADGQFSKFAGYERHIMALSGNGMKLDIEGDGIASLRPMEPFTFSGDARVVGSLLDGPVRDFNLIVRRDYGRGTLSLVECAGGHSFGGGQSHRLFHLLDGECSIGGERVFAGDSFHVAAGESVCLSGTLRMIQCEITPRWPP